MNRFENTQDLIGGILDGQLPRQVRFFAAQGLLPIPREDLLWLQILLSSDPDDELAEIAKASVAEVETATLAEWLKGYDLEPMVLDILIRLREEEEIWVGVATHDGTSDETMRVLANNGGPVVQDIIITNQVRIFGCLELLDDLRSNVRVTDTVLRRVREFEEEFLEKAIAAEEAIAAAASASIQDALDSLRNIGAHIPALEKLPYQKSEDPGLEQAMENAGGKESVFSKLTNMNVREKVMCALKGTREERSILISSRNRLVVRAVLASPKLSDSEVEMFAGSRSVDTEVLRIINRNPRWMRRYQVVLQLCLNPKTPVQIAINLVNRLNVRDLKRLTKNRNINYVVRRAADTFAERRR